jgi:N-acetylglucosaminyldiphosphoundecaprenol N-acetyl-beta-D-mannosaminyltransferase
MDEVALSTKEAQNEACTARYAIGGLPIDGVTLSEALERIEKLVRGGGGGTVVTPNVDHVVVAQRSEEFVRAYQAASLSLVDGTPLYWLTKLLGYSVPEKVSGSDLVGPLLEMAAAKSFRVYLLGGADGSGARARELLSQTLPSLEVVGVDASRIDLTAPPEVDAPIIERIRRANPHLLVVGLGAPKQEIWMYRHRQDLGPVVSLGLGACIDFLAGRVRRAPRWISAMGLEWVYRLALEPKRLARRYLVQDPAFVGIALRELFSRYR